MILLVHVGNTYQQLMFMHLWLKLKYYKNCKRFKAI